MPKKTEDKIDLRKYIVNDSDKETVIAAKVICEDDHGNWIREYYDEDGKAIFYGIYFFENGVEVSVTVEEIEPLLQLFANLKRRIDSNRMK